jgi:dolichol-phosphate mannosyltransferase
MPLKKGDLYTVILPTYNERDNLPVLVWLLVKAMTDRLASERPTTRLKG